MTAPEQAIGLAVIGYGYWGPNIVRNAVERPEFRLVAVADIDDARRQDAVRRYPEVSVHASVEAVLDDPSVDAVAIATPPGMHYELAQQAIEAGKHVLVEKPLATRSEQAIELIALAAEQGVVLMPGHTFLYSPPVNKVRELIQSGELGELYFVTSARMNLGIYQPHGVIWDLAPHDLSILMYWLGEPLVQVAATGRSVFREDVPEAAFLTLQFAGGAAANLQISWLAPRKIRQMLVVGSERMVQYDDTSADESVRIYDQGLDMTSPQNFGEYRLTYRKGDMVAPRVDAAEPLGLELQDFANAIVTGEEPRSNAWFGVEIIRAIEAAEASWRQLGEPVRVPVAGMHAGVNGAGNGNGHRARSPRARNGFSRRSLRVCMVHQSDFATDSRIQSQARALAARGDEVDCVGMSEAATIPVGEGLIRLHPTGEHKPNGGLRDYAGFVLAALRQVSRLDRELGFDLVEVHNLPDVLTFTALRPKVRGVPVVLNVHDTPLRNTPPEMFATMFGLGTQHPAVRAILGKERRTAALADALIFVTDEARSHMHARGVGNGDAHVVMNAPDESVFGPRREPVAPPVSGLVRVVYHGGLASPFGVDCLLEAFGALSTTLPEAILEVYGTAEDSGPTAARAHRLAPGAVMVSPHPVPLHEMPDRLVDAHIGVVSTLRNESTELLLPVELLRYVHLGIPVVTSRLPLIERYFSDREVRFFEPGSADSLAEAIVEISENPMAARRRAARAGERLEEFSWRYQRERYLALVDRLTPAGPDSSRNPLASFDQKPAATQPALSGTSSRP